MKKVLKNSKKTRAYLDSLPKIYLVGCWAKYGVREYPFTGKYKQDKYNDNISVPLVYDYDDWNGTTWGNYYLRQLTRVTTGSIIMWTQNKAVADKVAELLNKEMKDGRISKI